MRKKSGLIAHSFFWMKANEDIITLLLCAMFGGDFGMDAPKWMGAHALLFQS